VDGEMSLSTIRSKINRRSSSWTLNLVRSVLRFVRGRMSIVRFTRLYRKFLREPRRFTNYAAQQLLRQAFLASKGKSLEWAWQLQESRSPTEADVPIRSAL